MEFEERKMLFLEKLRINGFSYNFLNWDEINQCWVVEYKKRFIDYYIVHEYGHILLAKKKNSYSYFARTSEEVKKMNKKIESLDKEGKNLPKKLEEIVNIFNYSNHLIDCFVNYNSFNNISQYNMLYLNYIDNLLSLIKEGFKFTDLHELLNGYIGFYLEFN